jgi:hypothetical protein
MSNTLTYAAAGLMAATFVLHIYIGQKQVLPALNATDMVPQLLTLTLVLWHAVSVTLAVFAVALWHLSGHTNPALEATLAAVQIGFAALFLYYGATRLGTIWLLPQWVIFLVLPLLTRLGQYRAG